MCTHSEEKVELFYPKVFVEIMGNLPGSPIIVRTLFHATHYEEITRICDREQAVFKGNKKQWRQTNNPDKANYLVHHIYNGWEKIYVLQMISGCLAIWCGLEQQGRRERFMVLVSLSSTTNECCRPIKSPRVMIT